MNFSEQAIERGLDIVIGTPGRVQDMINKGHLNLSDIEHVILDEVDRMLDMGFADSVENIIRNCYKKGKFLVKAYFIWKTFTFTI